MAILDTVLIGTGALIAKKLIKEGKERGEREEEWRKLKEEERRRKNTPFHFTDGISEWEFKKICHDSARGFRRLEKIYTSGPIVYGEFSSQTGQTSYHFEIDFNDYGHFTGRFWKWSENDDSSIPGKLAHKIHDKILWRLDHKSDDYEFDFIFPNENDNKVDDAEDASDYDDEDDSEELNQETLKNKYNYFVPKDQKEKKDALLAILILIIIVIASSVYFYFENRSDEYEIRDEITVSVSASDLKGKNYEDVTATLKDIGFSNISLEEKEDVYLGIFKKDGKVESVTIDGNSDFSSGDRFLSNAQVTIVYHSKVWD